MTSVTARTIASERRNVADRRRGPANHCVARGRRARLVRGHRRRVSLSAPAVKRRVDRLRSAGVIRGFTAVVDPAAVGWTTEAFVELFCTGRTTPAADRRGHPAAPGGGRRLHGLRRGGRAGAPAGRRHRPPGAGPGAAAGRAVRHLHPQHDRAVPAGRLGRPSRRQPGPDGDRRPSKPPSTRCSTQPLERRGRRNRPTGHDDGRRDPVRGPRPLPRCHGRADPAGRLHRRPRLADARRTRCPLLAQLVAFDSCGTRSPDCGRRRRRRSPRAGCRARRPGVAGDGPGVPPRERRRQGAHRRRRTAAYRHPRPPRSRTPTTNIHEAGVDEPDLVKTDGRRIFLVNQGALQVVDPATRR